MSFVRSIALATLLVFGASPSWAQSSTATAAGLCRAAPELTDAAPQQGSTVGLSDRFHASCAREALSGERVYVLRVPEDSRVSLRAAADYDVALYVRASCDDAATEVACNDDGDDTAHAALDLDLRAGTYFVFVDGYDTDSQGRFELRVTMQPRNPRVGRGRLRPPLATRR